MPEQQNKPVDHRGLYGKFIVQRADGTDAPGGKHHGCRYFVLDLDHDPYAIAAIRAYAVACRTTHPNLAANLDQITNARVGKEQK